MILVQAALMGQWENEPVQNEGSRTETFRKDLTWLWEARKVEQTTGIRFDGKGQIRLTQEAWQWFWGK